MSLSNCYKKITRIENDLADLQKKIAEESRKESGKQKQIESTNRSMTSSISASTFQIKQRQIQGYRSDIVRIQATKADLQTKIANKTRELNIAKQELQKEEAKEKEQQKRDQEEARRHQQEFQQQQQEFQKEQEKLQEKLQADIEYQKDLLNTLVRQTHTARAVDTTVENKDYDFFISHATEDKNSFVRPLAELLTSKGYSVWYDEFQLTVGDSLRKKIDEGLIYSKYGIAVLSRDFFKKNWTEYELNGLVAREMNGVKVILPIWHNVTRDEVLSYSPTLADKVALNTALYSLEEIVTELGKLIDM